MLLTRCRQAGQPASKHASSSVGWHLHRLFPGAALNILTPEVTGGTALQSKIHFPTSSDPPALLYLHTHSHTRTNKLRVHLRKHTAWRHQQQPTVSHLLPMSRQRAWFCKFACCVCHTPPWLLRHADTRSTKPLCRPFIKGAPCCYCCCSAALSCALTCGQILQRCIGGCKHREVLSAIHRKHIVAGNRQLHQLPQLWLSARHVNQGRLTSLLAAAWRRTVAFAVLSAWAAAVAAVGLGQEQAAPGRKAAASCGVGADGLQGRQSMAALSAALPAVRPLLHHMRP